MLTSYLEGEGLRARARGDLRRRESGACVQVESVEMKE